MITWLTLWPFTLIPLIVTFFMGAFPEMNIANKVFNGGIIREWFLNNLLIPVLSDSNTDIVLKWFIQATYPEELGLHFLLSINVFALCFPFMFIIGTGIIRFSAWYSKTALKQKHTLLNK